MQSPPEHTILRTSSSKWAPWPNAAFNPILWASVQHNATFSTVVLQYSFGHQPLTSVFLWTPALGNGQWCKDIWCESVGRWWIAGFGPLHGSESYLYCPELCSFMFFPFLRGRNEEPFRIDSDTYIDLQKVVGCCRMSTKESVHDFCAFLWLLCWWWPCSFKRDLNLSHFHVLRHSWYLSILQWSLVVKPCLKLWAKFLGETNKNSVTHQAMQAMHFIWTTRHWTWFPWLQSLTCLERSKRMIVIQGQCCDREMRPLDKDWRFPTRGNDWCLVLLTFQVLPLSKRPLGWIYGGWHLGGRLMIFQRFSVISTLDSYTLVCLIKKAPRCEMTTGKEISSLLTAVEWGCDRQK